MIELVDIYEVTYGLRDNEFSVDLLNVGIDRKEAMAVRNGEVWYNPGRYICTIILPSSDGDEFSTVVTLGKQYILGYIEHQMDKAIQKYLED